MFCFMYNMLVIIFNIIGDYASDVRQKKYFTCNFRVPGVTVQQIIKTCMG